MRDPRTDPAVSRRLAMARYARIHGKSAAARHFGCSWATIQAALRRVQEYERTGDIRVLQNKPRGRPKRTPNQVEELVIAIYKESFQPERPKKRRYSAAKVARLLKQRHHITLSRKTVWAILRRRGVWEEKSPPPQPIRRFERSQPNELWQFDLIEQEETAIGKVYGLVIVDDYSRYLVGLRFFLTKEEQGVLFTTYLAMRENGTPLEILCDRGGQFVSTRGEGETHFQEIMDCLGIKVHVTSRPQTKGKNERLNQFIQRDFLDEVRWQIPDLEKLNELAEDWRRNYNLHHVNETTQHTPKERYREGTKVDEEFLRKLFAKEERRKVSREATVRYCKRVFKVPAKYIGWQVWVANFFDRRIEIYAGDKVIAAYDL